MSLHGGRVRDQSIARQSREMRPWISRLELALLSMRCTVLELHLDRRGCSSRSPVSVGDGINMTSCPCLWRKHKRRQDQASRLT